MKNPWIAAILNFFLMGLGTLYNGRRKALGIALTLGAIVLSWLEFQVRDLDATLYAIFFGTVFFMNIFFALDGYSEAKQINQAA